jgi:hypothetical protein
MAGTITTNAVVLGDSATAANNFQLRTNADGTAKLARGSAGTLGDILTINSSGQVALTQGLSAVPAQAGTVSMVRLNTANGYGSSSTSIRRFANITNGVNGCVIQGADITFADSATLGSSFTINTSGVYSISFNDTGTNNLCVGLSLNTTQPTVACYSLTNIGEILVTSVSFGANVPIAVSWTGYLPASSVIRPHNDGTPSGIPARCQFTITRVA